MQRIGKNRKSKIDFGRSFSVLADLDINFVLEGRVRFLWVFGFCFRSANLGFAYSYGRSD